MPWLDAVAALRLRVFSEFPYLYHGNAEYERDYLAGYAKSPGSVFVLAINGKDAVGCATGLPLTDTHAEFRAPFDKADIAVEDIFYFGESVLEPSFRGYGTGHAFFDEREGHARQLGFQITTFCAVVRPDDHPLRPAEHRPLGPFWCKRGYRPTELTAEFAWKDVDQPHETSKTMRFWIRKHSSTPTA